jgi:accessory colonization factor AcfC
MKYKVKVTPKHERESKIAAASQNPLERTTFHEYQNSAQQLPVIRVAIELPIYRMANGRTRTEQLKYLRQNALIPTFFSAGQENQEAQQAQHVLLEQFSREGSNSIIPIATILEEGKQTDPILITSSGVVVNGNRRLSAMRELHASGEAQFKTYSHVNALVLPAAISEKEIKEIELRLQMQPETKLPYTWVNEALTISDLMNTGFSREEIATDMRKTQKEVDVVLQALQHAQIYLKEWKKQPEQYDLVEKGAQQLFMDMAKLLKDKTGEELEVSRRIASDGLEIVIDEDTEGTSFKPLIEALDDSSRRDEIAEELIAVCESIKSAEQDEKRGQAALKAIKDANTRLTEVDLSNADAATYKSMLAQLESIIARATKLKEQISAHK